MFFYILWYIPSYYPNKQEDSNGGGFCLRHPRTSRWNFSRQSMFDRHLACWSNILSANGRCQHQQWGGKPYKNKPPWIFKCYIIKQKRWFLPPSFMMFYVGSPKHVWQFIVVSLFTVRLCQRVFTSHPAKWNHDKFEWSRVWIARSCGTRPQKTTASKPHVLTY